jgi:hypothetical protein
MNNLIGGTTAAERNVISGNDGRAIISMAQVDRNASKELHRRHRERQYSGNYRGVYIEGSEATSLADSFGAGNAISAVNSSVYTSQVAQRNRVRAADWDGRHGTVDLATPTEVHIRDAQYHW